MLFDTGGVCFAPSPRWRYRFPRRQARCQGFNAWFEKKRVGDLGYELERPYWNQGIMTEALTPIVSYGFEQIGLVQQRAWVIPQNKASGKVLLKIGFESQGVQLARGYWDGTFHDLELFTSTIPNPPDMTFPI